MNGIFISSDFGVNWSQTFFSDRRVYSLIVDGNNIFVGTNPGVYLSTNLGVNWIPKDQGFKFPPPVYSFEISNGYIFAATDKQSVWKRSLQEIVGIQNTSQTLPSKFLLYQNYPNPFNPVTKIKFAIPSDVKSRLVGTGSKTSDVKLIIYDITGREIQTLVNEKLNPGTYEVTFDGSNLSSGIYFYQMRSGEFIETKKLVLLK